MASGRRYAASGSWSRVFPLRDEQGRVSKLSASDAAVKVKGRIIKCEHAAKGEEVLVIEQLAQ
jgi:hypothetical protein